eukprot:TRINITY_DN1611_c0_g1_i2.p1 TRINITY_DN1611_c0_g1~~TRINITY_DN1611_c0_g1_i2.p1  ORF type:complete len:125 (-),score=43.02 TRINITY_DN1611_c0_g1_i2:58-432(-)
MADNKPRRPRVHSSNNFDEHFNSATDKIEGKSKSNFLQPVEPKPKLTKAQRREIQDKQRADKKERLISEGKLPLESKNINSNNTNSSTTNDNVNKKKGSKGIKPDQIFESLEKTKTQVINIFSI